LRHHLYPCFPTELPLLNLPYRIRKGSLPNQPTEAMANQFPAPQVVLAQDEGATGLEVEDISGGTEITQPFDPALIRVESKSLTISILLTRIEHGEINLNPGFQRKAGIWTKGAQSRLIESLLIRIPLPAFYMDGTDDDKWLVVDGLQRLTALKSFVLDKSLALEGLEFLKQYTSKTFDGLPRSFQRRILETQVPVFVIQENTPEAVKFNVFKRINTGGLPLSPQEIRHALNQGEAADMLHRLAEAQEFKLATDNGIRDERMGDRECVLRFLAFAMHSYEEYQSREFDTFLNAAMSEMNKMSPPQRKTLENRFLRAMRAAHEVFGDRAFRKQYLFQDRRSPINKALFETWSVTLDALDDEQLRRVIERKDAIVLDFRRLGDDAEFMNAISQGTGDVRKVRFRFSRIADITKEVIK
jgi:hypothetical protein